MRNDFESNYLAHHGILGQKWGKKNGSPYPLDSSQKSAAEKNQTSKTDKHKSNALKYAKNAVGVGAAAVVLGGVGLASNKGLIKLGNQYVKMYIAASKPALTVGMISNLAFAGANYAMYKYGIKDSRRNQNA